MFRKKNHEQLSSWNEMISWSGARRGVSKATIFSKTQNDKSISLWQQLKFFQKLTVGNRFPW